MYIHNGTEQFLKNHVQMWNCGFPIAKRESSTVVTVIKLKHTLCQLHCQ